MNRRCKGCGSLLQSDDPQALGYTPKADAFYCQRCFRITHYDDVMVPMQQGLDNDAILKQVKEMDALVLWVVDLFDFEANLSKELNAYLSDKDIVLVGTKRDLLPASMGDEKLIQFIFERLNAYAIKVNAIVVCGDMMHAHDVNNYSCEEVFNAVDYYRAGRDVVVIGMANAGKSTLLNALFDDQSLTTSRHPGTTLDFNRIEDEGFAWYDTPGLARHDSLLTHVDDRFLKQIVPMKEVHGKVYQIHGDQSFALSGLVRLDVFGAHRASVVSYFKNELDVHRGKQENADDLWNKHLGKDLLKITLDEHFGEMRCIGSTMKNEKMDVVIHGLGFFALSGDIRKVKVYVNKNVRVTFRKAML